MRSFDCVIIGAGPAGLTAALYLARSGFSTALLEKSAAGGQVLSTAEIENYPGFPKGISGWELADLFSAHLDGYPVERLRGDLSGIEAQSDAGKNIRILLAEGEAIEARSLILASGATHKKLGAPGETLLGGKGVSYCAVCDGNFYRGQDVAVIGGGNSALEEALYLARIVNKVYLIHRREGFRGAKHYLDKIKAMPDKIELVTSHVVDEILGTSLVEGLKVKQVQNHSTRILPVQGVFVYVGTQPNSAYCPAGLELSKEGFIPTDTEMRTNLPGIFAAGDIRVKHCRQVSSAVGDGATAATAAISYLEQYNA